MGIRRHSAFLLLAVTTLDCGIEGLTRAYQIIPLIAVNPGTSKRAFGFINTLKASDTAGDASQIEQNRIAIYASPEDYRDRHFTPPGAVAMTREELLQFVPQESLFEYLETYPEGVPLPDGYDPAAYTPAPSPFTQRLAEHTHFFLLGGKTWKTCSHGVIRIGPGQTRTKNSGTSSVKVYAPISPIR